MPRRRLADLELERQAAEAVELEEPRRLEVAVPARPLSPAGAKPVDNGECEHEWEDVVSPNGPALRQCRKCPAMGLAPPATGYAFGQRRGGF